MSAYLLGLGFRADMGTCIRKLVLLKLIDACEDDGTRIFPAIATIARAAQCSPRQAQREIRAMLDIGLLRLVREGGKGPRSTNEYSLDLDLLGLIARDGWQAVSADKGDTQSPLPEPEKGDSDDALRVTPATDKGDSVCRTTPPDPSPDPSIERERASARDDDRKKIERLFERAWRDWPVGAAGSRPEAFRVFHGLAPEERQSARDGVPRWLAAYKAAGRGLVPAFSRYLAERRWEELPEQEPEAPKPAYAPPFGPDWSARRMALLLAGPTMPVSGLTPFERVLVDRGEADEAALMRQKAAKVGFPLVNGMHEQAMSRRGCTVEPEYQALAALMEAVPVGSEIFEAWRREHERRGWPWVPDPGEQRVVFFPKGGPTGWAAFEVAVRGEAKGHDGGGCEAAE